MSTPSDGPAPATSTPAPPAEANPARPPSNAGWAVASLLFFWPLAFASFTHAFEVYPRWASGDPAGAREASDQARRLGQISLWLFGALLLTFVVVCTIATAVASSRGYGTMWQHPRWR